MMRKLGIGLVAAILLTAAPVMAQQKATHGRATPTGAMFTTALNLLYAKGWHNVTSLSEKGGIVHATAINPDGKQASVQINTRAGTLQPE